MTMNDVKSIFKSKTFWINAAVIVIAVATMLTDPVQYGPEVAKWAAVVLAAVNIGLRMITTGPVAVKPQKAVDKVTRE